MLHFKWSCWLIVCLLSTASTRVHGQGVPCGARSGCQDYRPRETAIPKPTTIDVASPNFSQRDYITPLDTVVIHTTEVGLSGTLRIFQNPENTTSAHFVVAPNGDIYQMVDTVDRAHHATYYNSRSIGIEMVGYAGLPTTWNERNLGSLVDLLSWILSAYPDIPLVHPGGNAYDYPGDVYDEKGLVAHGQVQPWNRSDPGRFFPWQDVMDAVGQRIAAVPEPNSLCMCVLLSFHWMVCGRRFSAR